MQRKSSLFGVLLILVCLVASGCGKSSDLPPEFDGPQGVAGAAGKDAVQSQYDIVGVENPCGDAPGIYDEIFLRLRNNTLVASFSDNTNGNNTRFVLITPGTYRTTDGDSCTFTVDSTYHIVNESHHN